MPKIQSRFLAWSGFAFGLIAITISVLTYISSEATEARAKTIEVRQYFYEAMDLLGAESKEANSLLFEFNGDTEPSLHKTREQFEQVRRLIEKILLLDPDNQEIEFLKFVYLVRFGDINGAQIQLGKMRDIGGEISEAEIYGTMGMIYMGRLKSEDLAIKYFEKSLELEPNNVNTLAIYGMMLHSINKNDRSIELLEAALKFEPNDPNLNNKLAHVLAESGRPEEAVKHLNHLISQRQANAETYNGLGVLLAGMGKHNEAIENYKHALKLDPNNGIFNFNISLSLKEIGNLEYSEKHKELAKQFWKLPTNRLDDELPFH